MPNLVGRSLRGATSTLQAVGIALYTRSHDLTGKDREQILDDSWKVCDQSPRAGQPVPPGTVPDFGVVKLTESCR
jgi:beta-lactam-binding protein with PASTA domain